MVNEALAIPEVESFLNMVSQLEAMEDPAVINFTLNPAYEPLMAAINQSLALIKQIADECIDGLAARIEKSPHGSFGYSGAVSATNELLGFLQSSDKRKAIFAPTGPKLAASNMHPWVWGAVSQLWDDGHHREAVSKAASSIFDVYLPAKVQMPKGTQPDAMLGKAFSGTPPFLNIPGCSTPGQDRTNAYEGSQNLGLACAKLVRNLATHNVTAPGDEDVLLEELAMLSRFARIIDSSTV